MAGKPPWHDVTCTCIIPLWWPLWENAWCGCAQTRLPGELALELEGIATEYEADLMYFQQEATDSDSEEEDEDAVEPLRPLRNFPAVALITAIHSFIEVRARAPAPLCRV